MYGQGQKVDTEFFCEKMECKVIGKIKDQNVSPFFHADHVNFASKKNIIYL